MRTPAAARARSALRPESLPAAARSAHVGDRLQQRPGVRVRGRGEEDRPRRPLHHAAQVHHGHRGRHVRDHRQVVADEEPATARAGPAALSADSAPAPAPTRRARRSARHRPRAPARRQRPGDRQPLPLAARELMRVLAPIGVGQPHLSRSRRPVRAAPRRRSSPPRDRLRRSLHPPPWVERRVRVLEHHLDPRFAAPAAVRWPLPRAAVRAGGSSPRSAPRGPPGAARASSCRIPTRLPPRASPRRAG